MNDQSQNSLSTEQIAALNAAFDFLYAGLREAKQRFETGDDAGRDKAIHALEVIIKFLSDWFEPVQAEVLQAPLARLFDDLMSLDDGKVSALLKPKLQSGRARASGAYDALKGIAVFTVRRLEATGLRPIDARKKLASTLNKLNVRPARKGSAGGTGQISERTLREWQERIAADVGCHTTAAKTLRDAEEAHLQEVIAGVGLSALPAGATPDGLLSSKLSATEIRRCAKGHKLLDDVRRANNAPLLETLIQQSGRGPDGHHLIYNLPQSKSVGRVTRKDLGVDIIGNGGYIVVDPSNHISGGVYQWISRGSVADPDPWLMNWVWSLFEKGPRSFSVIDIPGLPSHAGKRSTRIADGTPDPAPIWSEYEERRLRSALDCRDTNGKRVWDPDGGYEIWSKIVAAAIASLGWGSKGEDIFVYFSAQTTIDGYFPGEEACRDEVRSYKRGRVAGCITEATIYKPVIDAGWKEPESASNENSANNTFFSANKTGPEAGANTNRQGASLPTIQVIGGGLSNEATAGEEAIISAGHPIYRRGTMLVRPVVQEVDATRRRRTKVAQLLSVSLPYMSDLLCKSAKWDRYDRREKKRVRINPPGDIAGVILNRCGHWMFDEIVGVITTPTLRPDGSLLLQPGYDPITRLILVEPPAMPAIPEQPTQDDAMAALKLLDSLFDEFPFADDASRSVALSCLITPVVRGAFPVAPMHAACAPSAGTGKSYLLDIAAAIAIGQPCPVMAAGRTEEETEKRLGAALLAGQPIINIDNVNGELGGDALCQIIERPVVEIRILGKSERVRIETRCSIFATGNNLCLLGDMTRRVVRCTLDANQERPELRQFKRDPVADVLADRGRYVAAVLTIVRAYIVAGRPRVASRLPSFEGWSDTVRSALIWPGRADPVQTMETARKDDPQLQAMEAVFAALKEAIGIGNKCTVAEVIQLADQRFQVSPLSSVGIPSLKHPGLKEALQNIAGDRVGVIDARALGKWFSRHKGRIAKGVRLEGEADEHGHPARWWLINCG
jgi:hypothetical protein